MKLAVEAKFERLDAVGVAGDASVRLFDLVQVMHVGVDGRFVALVLSHERGVACRARKALVDVGECGLRKREQRIPASSLAVFFFEGEGRYWPDVSLRLGTLDEGEEVVGHLLGLGVDVAADVWGVVVGDDHAADREPIGSHDARKGVRHSDTEEMDVDCHGETSPTYRLSACRGRYLGHGMPRGITFYII